jgi:hypothetical protein
VDKIFSVEKMRVIFFFFFFFFFLVLKVLNFGEEEKGNPKVLFTEGREGGKRRGGRRRQRE